MASSDIVWCFACEIGFASQKELTKHTMESVGHQFNERRMSLQLCEAEEDNVMDPWTSPVQPESTCSEPCPVSEEGNVVQVDGATTLASAASESANVALEDGAASSTTVTSDNAMNNVLISDVVRQAVSAALDVINNQGAASLEERLNVEMERAQVPCHLWSTVLAAVQAVLDHVKPGRCRSPTIVGQETKLFPATTTEAQDIFPELVLDSDAGQTIESWDIDDPFAVDRPSSPVGRCLSGATEQKDTTPSPSSPMKPYLPPSPPALPPMYRGPMLTRLPRTPLLRGALASLQPPHCVNHGFGPNMTTTYRFATDIPLSVTQRTRPTHFGQTRAERRRRRAIERGYLKPKHG